SVIKRVSQLANKRVPKELEDKIVESITSGKEKLDFGTISKMLNNK
ncbi:stage VI sporulation protein F, partial [Bacillus atrophaeus]